MRMSKTNFVRVATVVFIVVGLGHLYRVISGLPVNIMGWDVPMAVSWVAVVAAAVLVWSGYKHWS